MTEENENYPFNLVAGFLLVTKASAFGTMFGGTVGEQIIGVFYTKEAAEWAKEQVKQITLDEMNMMVNPEIRQIYLELPPEDKRNDTTEPTKKEIEK